MQIIFRADVWLNPFSDTRKQSKISSTEFLNTFHPKLRNRLIETKDKILDQNKSINAPLVTLSNCAKWNEENKIEKNNVTSNSQAKTPMTDIEIEKLEKLLNCKNKAVKKWIEEKEQHYDNLTQKLLKNGKKLARHMSLKSQNIWENKVLDQLSESHPSSIRITESENEGI